MSGVVLLCVPLLRELFAWHHAGRVTRKTAEPREIAYVSPFLLPAESSASLLHKREWDAWYNARERYATTPTAEHSDACTLILNINGNRYLDHDACRACWFEAMLNSVTPTNPPDRPISR
jgi:hypothetical protein